MRPDDDAQSDVRASEVPERFADDQFYQALAERRRRRILAHMLACDRCTVEELVDVLCGWEAATSRTVDASAVEQLHIELGHRHLPQLEEAGLLRYDRDAGEVIAESLSAPVEQLVRRSIEAENPD